MRRKISMLTIAIVLTVILFSVSTYLQRKLINYEPVTKCYVAKENIERYEKVEKEIFKEIQIPITIVMNMKIIQNLDDIENLYAENKVYAGQILVKEQFKTSEELSLFEGEKGKEKIAIKIKSAENGVSYRIKERSIINVYATLRTEYANNVFPERDRQLVGGGDDGYSAIKILDSVRVIGVFDNNGLEITERTEELIPDTVMISVTHDEARDINLIRDLATFNITELEEETQIEDISY